MKASQKLFTVKVVNRKYHRVQIHSETNIPKSINNHRASDVRTHTFTNTRQHQMHKQLIHIALSFDMLSLYCTNLWTIQFRSASVGRRYVSFHSHLFACLACSSEKIDFSLWSYYNSLIQIFSSKAINIFWLLYIIGVVVDLTD